MTATVAKAPVGRPKNPRDLAERTELIRVASLAASVLVSLRQSGCGEYSSERMLRQFLSDDNVSFTSADLAPALGLLEGVGKIGRGLDKGNNSPRSGWLVSDSQRPVHTSVSPAVSEAMESVPEPAGDITETIELDPVDVLADKVVRALFAGNGAVPAAIPGTNLRHGSTKTAWAMTAPL